MENKHTSLTPWQIVGLTDAEGMFFAASYPNKKSYTVITEFKITQMNYSVELLKQVQKELDCGSIVVDNESNGSLKFTVKDPKVIAEKIIPFFDQYNLVTPKILDYLNFRAIVLLIVENKSEGQSIDADLHAKIEEIRSTSNTKREDLEIYNFCEEIDLSKVDDGWIAGFIEGDGTFQIYLQAEPEGGFKKAPLFYASIEITQKFSRRPLLKAFVSRFKSGLVKPSLKKESFEAVLASVQNKTIKTHRYDLKGTNVIVEHVIPLLNRFTFFSVKGKDYKDWLKIIAMYKNGDHKTLEGRNTMRAIKSGMNAGRNVRKR